MIKKEQKHFNLILDSGLTFFSHVRGKTISARRGVGVIRYLSKYATRDEIYKLYVWPHVHYDAGTSSITGMIQSSLWISPKNSNLPDTLQHLL